MRSDSRVFIYGENAEVNMKYVIKYIISIFMSFFYKIVCYLPYRKGGYVKKYRLSFCSIFKNEAPYLREWIEYHRLIGVEHFYLYNNNSSDNYVEILKPYIDEGIVTLTDWPEVPGQLTSYLNWYERFRNDTKWVSFLDLDEFYCPLRDTNLVEWLDSNFSNYPIVYVYWKMFGTCGKLENKDNELVVEQFVNSWEKHYACGKLFYNTSYDLDKSSCGVGMMHWFKVRKMGVSIPPINIFKKFVVFPDIHRYSSRKIDIQLNHYWSKSYENYEAKHSRGSAAWGKSWKTYEKFLWHETKNISCDYSIFRFLIQLKLKLNGTQN